MCVRRRGDVRMDLGKGARFGAAVAAVAGEGPASAGEISNFFGVKGARGQAYAEGA